MHGERLLAHGAAVQDWYRGDAQQPAGGWSGSECIHVSISLCIHYVSIRLLSDPRQ